MEETLLVKAGANGPVPLPAPIQGRSFIGAEPMEIPNSRFIRRRLEVLDLVLVERAARAAVKPAKEKE